jgi:hypothetical protein
VQEYAELKTIVRPGMGGIVLKAVTVASASRMRVSRFDRYGHRPKDGDSFADS